MTSSTSKSRKVSVVLDGLKVGLHIIHYVDGRTRDLVFTVWCKDENVFDEVARAMQTHVEFRSLTKQPFSRSASTFVVRVNTGSAPDLEARTMSIVNEICEEVEKFAHRLIGEVPKRNSAQAAMPDLQRASVRKTRR